MTWKLFTVHLPTFRSFNRHEPGVRFLVRFGLSRGISLDVFTIFCCTSDTWSMSMPPHTLRTMGGVVMVIRVVVDLSESVSVHDLWQFLALVPHWHDNDRDIRAMDATGLAARYLEVELSPSLGPDTPPEHLVGNGTTRRGA